MNLCREIMITDVPYVLSSATLETVSCTMKHHDTKVIPILDNIETKKVLGLITEEDLVYKVMAEGRNPKVLASVEFANANFLKFKENDSAEDALHFMQDSKIEWIPVVDDEDHLLGILHASEVIKQARPKS